MKILGTEVKEICVVYKASGYLFGYQNGSKHVLSSGFKHNLREQDSLVDIYNAIHREMNSGCISSLDHGDSDVIGSVFTIERICKITLNFSLNESKVLTFKEDFFTKPFINGNFDNPLSIEHDIMMKYLKSILRISPATRD